MNSINTLKTFVAAFCISICVFSHSSAEDTVLSIVDDVPPGTSEDQIFNQYTLIGETSFKVMWFSIYDAQLRVSSSEFDWSMPFALTLTYKRDITSKRIVESSLKEMTANSDRDPHDFDRYRDTLQKCFPDVSHGDRFTGLSSGDDVTLFFLNGEERCRASEAGFKRDFFGIWLGDNTRDDRKSRALRGLDD